MGNKQCTKCKIDTPLEEFKVRSNGRTDSWCKKCNRESSKLRYSRNPEPFKKRAHEQRNKIRAELKDRLARIRTHGCTLCPESDPVCLDFHHYAEKDRPMGHFSHVPSFEKELVKCVLVCANCHRKIHAGVLNVTSEMCLQSNAGKI